MALGTHALGRTYLSVAMGLALFSPGAQAQTLTLSGSGDNTARAEDYPNYNTLIVDSGSWHLYGALVPGNSTLRSGTRVFLNGNDNLGSGLTTVEGATLLAQAPEVTLQQQIRLQPGGLVVDGDNTLVLNGLVYGGGGINKIGTGELFLRGTNTYTAYTMIGNGVLNVQANSATSTGVMTFNGTGNGVLRSSGQNVTLNNFFVSMAGNGTIDTQSNLTFNGRIGGGGTLTKTGAGRLRFTGTWSNYGNIVLREGVIDMASNVELGGGTLVVYGGGLDSDINQTFYNPIELHGTLLMNSARNWNFAGQITGNGDLDFSGNALMTLSGTNTFAGNVWLRNGTLAVGSTQALGSATAIQLDGGVLTNTLALNSPNTLFALKSSTIDAAFDWSMGGELRGTGALNKQGAGVLTLAGSTSAFSGGLFARQGLLNVVQSYTGQVGADTNARINLGNNSDRVWAQSLRGQVHLGGGDDVFDASIQSLAQILGLVDGGSGHNVMNITNSSGVYEASLNPTLFNNFGTLNIDGNSLLRLSNDGRFVPSDASVFGLTVGALAAVDLNGHTLEVGRANVLGDLLGSGTLDGNIFSQGFIAPSGIPNGTGGRAERASMGRMTVLGDLTSSGNWVVRTNALGASDEVVVDGVATVDGGTVVARPMAGSYADRTVYSFLRAQRVAGGFDGVEQNTFAFLTATLEQHEDGVDLVLSRAVAPVEPPVVAPEPEPVVEPKPPVIPEPEPPVVPEPPVIPEPEPPVVPEPVVEPQPPAQPEPPVVPEPVGEPQPPVEAEPSVPEPQDPVVEAPLPTPLAPPPVVVLPEPGRLRFDDVVGLTRNQKSMAGALQQAEFSGQLDVLLGQVRGLQTNEVQETFDLLTGETYAAVANSDSVVARAVAQSVLQRRIDEGVAVWMDTLLTDNTLERNIDTATVDQSGALVVAGLDAGTQTVKGGLYAYSGRGTLDSVRSEKFQAKRVGVGARGEWNARRMEVKALIGYGRSDWDVRRETVVAGNDAFVLRSASNTTTLTGALEARVRVERKAWSIAPMVGAYYIHASMDSLVEQGGDARLAIAGHTARSMVVGGGLDVARFAQWGNGSATMYASVQRMHNSGTQASVATASFANSGLEFQLIGARQAQNWWNTRVGVDVRTQQWTLSAEGRVELTGGAKSYAARIGATYHF